MQCIPLPENPTRPRTELRLFNNQGYDNREFITYPDRQGWPARPTIEWTRLFDKPPPAFVAFLERWLFFSFAQTIFSPDTKRFIEQAENQSYPVLTTAHLPALSKRLRDSNRPGLSADMVQRIKQCLRIHGLLCIASSKKIVEIEMSETRTLPGYIEDCATVDPRRPAMVTATSSLVEVAMAAMDTTDFRDPYSRISPGLGFPWTSHMWRLLREDGWCPSELNVIFAQSDTISLWYLYHFTRPSPHQTHRFLRTRDRVEMQPGYADEELCTASSCLYKRLNDDTYITKHVDGCDNCDDAIANPESYCSILREDKIPLISVSDEGDEKINVVFRAAEPGCNYIAISHIWSDGLGNPHRNAIPSCQFRRLSKIVREYQNTALFWFDTLCVPPDKANLKSEQDKAMGLMRKAYEDAKAVLVLDSWTTGTTHKHKSDVENLYKIFHCSWNTRLWTFQEAALAQTLLFQFRDGWYNVDEGIKRIKANKDISIEVTVKPTLIGLYDRLRGFRKSGGSITDLFKFIVKSIAIRTTSVPADEPLCLSALLNFSVPDIEKIAKEPHQLRMRKFWEMLDSIPSGFIFVSEYERIDVDGLRWAPKTLLGVGQSLFLGDMGLLTRTKDGLLGTGSGLRLYCGDIDIPQTIWLLDPKNNLYRVILHLSNCAEAEEFVFPGDKTHAKYVNIKKAYNCDEIGFISQQELIGDFEKPRDDGQDNDLSDIGDSVALFAITKEDGGRIYGRLVCVGLIEKAQPDIAWRNGDVIRQIIEGNKKRRSPVEVEKLSLTPDNIYSSFDTGNMDMQDIKELAKSGILSVKSLSGTIIKDKRTEKMVAGICWGTFGAHAICLGMTSLFNQILCVVALLVGTYLTAIHIGDSREAIGNRLWLEEDMGDPKWNRSLAYARLEMTDTEEECMVRWGLMPQRSNTWWWNRYQKEYVGKQQTELEFDSKV
ncbi:hypothetical protein F5Y00DRAFT_265975 [Daldinia vernicosa]|uniref:uncharacterized protein n=1 Tax=Daldinia vernicosa TaxID=114800 RepID=UPI00200855CC|nr:uncharacterized protein F5Y00DRAFT_265975 [Daldinia vernicosa]KAI0845010.1 hypothetical protein F5Y00DRAFT_265975 [Daldinia vernicosa]